MNEKIAVLGLGYVGLPVAAAFAKKFPGTVGFDVNTSRLAGLRDGSGHDAHLIEKNTLQITDDLSALKPCTFFVVAVPTPIDAQRRPNLTPLIKASESVGKVLKKGDVVVYESTVYPGVTEDVCAPVLERVSGLKREDFHLGYSPERINPGDTEHTLERITKIVSGEDEKTLDRVAKTYEAIIDAGVFRAASIQVAEAAKVIENTQRDLNIALMNELAIIFGRMNLRTKDVLEAAGTKWNFLKFTPGLVGGHCISVDPYYLTTKAEELGYNPQVILAGRRINDGMGAYVAQQVIKRLIHAGRSVKNARVALMGLTFKENVPDIRNSRVPDIIRELREFGIEPIVHDPLASAEDAEHEYGVTLHDAEALNDVDALIVSVGHEQYLKEGRDALLKRVRDQGVFADVKSCFHTTNLPRDIQYWSL